MHPELSYVSFHFFPFLWGGLHFYANLVSDRSGGENKHTNAVSTMESHSFISIHTWNAWINRFNNSQKKAIATSCFKVWRISHILKQKSNGGKSKGFAPTFPCDTLSFVTCAHPITKTSPFIGHLHEAWRWGESTCCGITTPRLSYT